MIHPPLHLSTPRDILGAQFTLHPVRSELQSAHALCCDGGPNPCSTPDTSFAPYGYNVACSVNIPGLGEYKWKSRVCHPIPLAHDVLDQPQAPQEPAQHHGHAPENNTLKRNYEETVSRSIGRISVSGDNRCQGSINLTDRQLRKAIRNPQYGRRQKNLVLMDQRFTRKRAKIIFKIRLKMATVGGRNCGGQSRCAGCG